MSVGRLCLLLCILATTINAISFSGQITVSADPLVTGILTGRIDYNWNSANQFDLGNSYQITYNALPAGGVIYEILKTVTASGSTQYQNVRYLICGASCDATTYTLNYPNLWITGMSYQTSDSYGHRWLRSGAAASDVSQVWYSTNSPSNFGTIVRAQFGNGKVWTFGAVSTSVGAFAGTSACPTPTCTVVADIVQVIDDSGSIPTSSFNNAVRPFAVNICNSYEWAVNGAAGITMAGVFFSSTARTILAWTTSKSGAIAAFNQGSYSGGATCISCGITQAVTLFNNRLSGRSAVSKLVFFMTDGYHNTPSGSSITPSVTASKNAGITTVAIGVGSSVSQSQLVQIASTISGVQTVFQVNDFASLANIKNQLVGVTCTTLSSSPCGSGCAGFCSCNAQCICPQCDTSNQCLVPSCTVGQFSTGCTYGTRTCNDGNACTSNSCNPSTGCVFTNITSTCLTSDNCRIEGCNPSSGCTAQQRVCTSTDPCYAASCSPSTPGGCVLTPQTCDTCKIPLVGGGRSPTTRPCPDNNSQDPNERDDNNECKDWYCDPSVYYDSDQFTPGSPQRLGRCLYNYRTCSNNNCTNNTCVPSTGLCNSVDTSQRCVDSNPCTHDRCDPVSGCSNTIFNISECYALTGGQFSNCFEYVLNTSIPTCCQAINKSFEWCGMNLTDDCLSWQCLDLSGCNYFTRNCEAEIGLDVLGECQAATCTNGTTWDQNDEAGIRLRTLKGCFPQLIEGKQKDKCGYCEGSAESTSKCVSAINTEVIVGISAGIIAAIIIAVIVVCLICGAVGGKVGLDYYRKYKGKMNNLQSNPLYEDKQKGGVNPFYQESEMSAK